LNAFGHAELVNQILPREGQVVSVVAGRSYGRGDVVEPRPIGAEMGVQQLAQVPPRSRSASVPAIPRRQDAPCAGGRRRR